MAERTDLQEAARRDPFGRGRRVVVPRALVRAADASVVVALLVLLIADRVRTDVVGYFAIGCGIGDATCIPIGIANVIVLDAAYRYGATRAIGAGIGGALADGIYVSLGIFGIGPLLAAHSVVPLVLHAVSGCVLVVYGAVLLRSRPLLSQPGEQRRDSRGSRELGRGVVIGLAATLLNPSAIVTWVVIVGSHAAGVTPLQGGSWVAGIVIGTLAWFLAITALAMRGRNVLRGSAAWLSRVLGLLVIASGALSLARVGRLVWSH
jgi:L-lysine exporter family protein LysE/ArgO